MPESKSEEVGGNGQPWLKAFLSPPAATSDVCCWSDYNHYSLPRNSSRYIFIYLLRLLGHRVRLFLFLHGWGTLPWRKRKWSSKSTASTVQNVSHSSESNPTNLTRRRSPHQHSFQQQAEKTWPVKPAGRFTSTARRILFIASLRKLTPLVEVLGELHTLFRCGNNLRVGQFHAERGHRTPCRLTCKQSNWRKRVGVEPANRPVWPRIRRTRCRIMFQAIMSEKLEGEDIPGLTGWSRYFVEFAQIHDCASELLRGLSFWPTSHCQNDAELCVAAHHSRVSLGGFFERIGFNHGTHAA